MNTEITCFYKLLSYAFTPESFRHDHTDTKGADQTEASGLITTCQTA